MVECDLAKVDVAGSSPVSRSRLPEAQACPFRRRGSQVVRQRSAKPLFVGSIPTRASIPQVLELTVFVFIFNDLRSLYDDRHLGAS